MKCLAMTLSLCIFLGILSTASVSFGQETEAEALLRYEATKKEPFFGLAAAFLIPTLGHAYAEDWWPRGAKFLAFYVGSIALMTGEKTAPIGVLALIGCRIWEYADAYWAVKDYNRELARRLGVEFSLYRGKPYLHISCRF